jgi:hypothetical protein
VPDDHRHATHPGDPHGADSAWDVAAIRAGAGVCVVFAAVPQLVAQFLDEGSSLGFLLRLVALGGFALGAGVAAWVQRRGLPLKHGLATGLGAFVVIQCAFIIGRGVLGDDLRIANLVANLPLVLGASLFGGFLGAWLQRNGVRPGTLASTRPVDDDRP